MNLHLVRAGAMTSVQAGPRLGGRQFGISSGGALDAVALRSLNALVANEAQAASVEICSGIVRLKFADARLIAWAGGEYEVRLGQNLLAAGHVALVQTDEEIVFSGPNAGFRAWLAISGGIDVPDVLGSRSTDLRGNFGGYRGRALEDGDILPLGPISSRAQRLVTRLEKEKVAPWRGSFAWTHPSALPPVLHFVRGKDWESFEQAARDNLCGTTFLVTQACDRMGIRLRGPVLTRTDKADLNSEAVVPGTLQVPASGDPILLLGNCQTIGGYPKLAHVISADLPRAAQLRPGDGVMFQEVSLTDAYARLWEIERDLARFSVGLEFAKR